MKRWTQTMGLLLWLVVTAIACGGGGAGGASAGPGEGDQTDILIFLGYTLYSGSSSQSGYDLVNGGYTGNAGGDFYFSAGALWANEPGQRGLVSVGPCTTTSGIRPPTSGYTQGPVQALAGNCYVVLSQGDVRDFGIVRVTSASASMVRFVYSLVTSDDFGATLTSGSNATGGYDFLAQAYRGASGGDLYYYSGAFWANNYDERGVESLGACDQVDSVGTFPAPSFSRYGVTATVGNCYASPLHANNRSYAVFRVDSMTATTVTLTWRLMPVPWNQLAWQHCENWHNYAHVAATTTTDPLLVYLATYPQITAAMQWISDTAPGLPATPVPYAQWPASMKSALLQNFVAYWAWYAGGMTGADPTPVVDPPTNLTPANGSSTVTTISEADAQALYVKYLALTFVVELQHQVPWSLLDYDAASLAELLDARKFYTQWTGQGYALVDMSVIPAPPLSAAQYVAAHHWLCTDRPKTIAEAVFWARDLKHVEDNVSDWASMEIDTWQYAGNPPASRVLAGTHYTGTASWVSTNLIQWTYGCHGTTGLLKSLLRTLNIPVEHFSNRNPTITVPNNSLAFQGHAVPHFISEHLWMSHGDDPYQNSYWEGILPFPIAALEISEAQFFAWYPSGTQVSGLIGQNQSLVWATYGSQAMIEARYQDLTTHPTPPDANFCALFTPGANGPYTCAQVEQMGLLTTIDALVQPYLSGPFSTLKSDEYAMPYYYDPEPQFIPPPCSAACMATACSENAACCSGWNWDCSLLTNAACGSLCSWPPP